MATAKKEPSLKAFDLLIADLTAQREELNAKLNIEKQSWDNLSERFDASQADLLVANTRIAQLEKELEEAKRMKKYHSDNEDKEKLITAQMHLLLDGLPGAMPRIGEFETTFGCSKEVVSPVTRLGSFLGSLLVGKL